MRILLVDTTLYCPTTPLFRDAIAASGHPYRFVDEGTFLAPLEHSLIHKVAYRLLHRRPLSYRGSIARSGEARTFRPDAVLIVKGTYVALGAIKREAGAFLVNYATDDSFNPAHSAPDLLTSIPTYDLYCSTKHTILGDLREAGAHRVAISSLRTDPTCTSPSYPQAKRSGAGFHRKWRSSAAQWALAYIRRRRHAIRHKIRRCREPNLWQRSS